MGMRHARNKNKSSRACIKAKKRIMSNIATKWRALSRVEEWKGLVDPLNLDLRRYIIHYGERVQVVYDAFIGDEKSRNCRLSRYSKRHLFSKVGLEKGNPYEYEVKKYFYATTDITSCHGFIKKSIFVDLPAGDSNWIGYVALSTDSGKTVLGRRDILICWRGTQGTAEWNINKMFDLASASKILGEGHNPKVHSGWYSLYSTAQEGSTYNSTSCREQVLSEIGKLVKRYKDEEVSITVTGHSLGAALATLNAVDIVYNGYNIPPGPRTIEPIKHFPVTTFVFAVPRAGDNGFFKVFSNLKNELHVLRINNKPSDIVPYLPPSVPIFFPYVDVGKELIIDTCKSPYLKKPTLDITLPESISNTHNLEVYLHGVAGTCGNDGQFILEVDRQIELANKMSAALKYENNVLDYWWTMENKSMIQNDHGSWVLMDHESDELVDGEEQDYGRKRRRLLGVE
ncbi:phospholipase A1-IIgamma-like [Corylus avellana]|uniref:phospholipase A1-IIgamma-like n=1 Tax=Corylus avellana TaxID=13451 RepID=UPI00286A24E2|nr:phospholipase A1-IIgamma-like [Corylus avellana]